MLLRNSLIVVSAVIMMAMSVSADSSRVEYRDFDLGVGASMSTSFFAAKDSSLTALIEMVNADSSLGLAFHGQADGEECDDAQNVGYAFSRAFAIQNRALNLGLDSSKVIEVEAGIVSDTGSYYRCAWVEVQSIVKPCTTDNNDLIVALQNQLTASNERIANLELSKSSDTTTIIKVRKLNLIAGVNGILNYSSFNDATVGATITLGGKNFYFEGTGTASFDANSLGMMVHAAFPLSAISDNSVVSRFTLLLGGSSQMDDGDRLYAFNAGFEAKLANIWNQDVSLRIIGTPGERNGHDDYDLNEITVQLKIEGLSISVF